MSQVISNYRIIKKLGAGAVGQVYLAEDLRLGRKVAIKLLRSELAGNAQATKAFLKEARAAASLDHPNICAVHEVGQVDGHCFIVMQYVEGATLAEKLRTGRLELTESFHIALQIAEALAEAHSHGIIHGDIKPHNVIVTLHGQVKLMDFGLARVVEADTNNLSTEKRGTSGTIPYMSPEQVRGEPIDARSDIFSFGVVLYEIVSGSHPFAADSAGETFSAILNRKPAPLGAFRNDIPLELENIINRAIEKNPDERYQSAREILHSLLRLRDRLGVESSLPDTTDETVGPTASSQTSQLALRSPWITVNHKG